MATILIADDRAINREFLTTLLSYGDHRIIEAADGAAALEIARAERPHLVVSDIVMPTMDGVEFARRLRADPATKDIPVIFYTASYRLGEARALTASCDACTVLTKPSEPQAILEAVAAALGRPPAPRDDEPPPPRLGESAKQDLSLSLRLSMLLELALELAAERDPQRLLELACRAARDILDTRYVAIVTVDSETGARRHWAADGVLLGSGAEPGMPDPRGELFNAVLKEGQARRVGGQTQSAGARGFSADPLPVDSLLVVPLVSALRSHGCLYLADKTSGEPLSDADEQIATTLASKLGQAYDNLLLYETMQRYAARLAADSEAIRSLNAGLQQEIEARRISERRFSMAMEVSPTVTFMLNRDLRYTWIHNPKIGIGAAEIIGRSVFELFTEETASALEAVYRGVIDTGVGVRRDISVRPLQQPADMHFDLIVDPLRNADGEIIGVIGASVDITERKHVEEKLRAAKREAIAANNAKSRFLAAASHDLRQPLSALNLYVDLMKSRATPTDTPLLQNMKDCVGSLSEMLSDLLDLSKLEAGVVTPEITDFRIDDVLAQVISAHAPAAQAKGLALRCTPTKLMVRTDRVLFARVFTNFVSNAVRYTERGGVLIGCRRRRQMISVEVWDTGIGIPEDKTSEIFEEFHQLGNTARDRTKGSGLGLAIAAKAAALLGLQIRVRSRLGHGSVFAIEVPVGNEVAEVRTLESAPRRLRIALVEDDAFVAGALVAALSSLGHEVVAAGSGAELFDRLGSAAPDIVISDYRLGDAEDGLGIIAAARKAFGAALPALLMTGDTDPQVIRKVAESEVSVLHKPVELGTLRACIERLVGRGTAIAA